MASTTSSTSLFVVCSSIIILLLANGGVVSAAVDYGAALTKSLLFYEAQRSGKLPPNQRVQWRADSAMNDGRDAGVDLVGGYYDSGDHVKYGFPMAFAVTMLSWSAVEFGTQLQAKKQLSNTLEAIKWGTDYFIKAHARPNLLYGQVGEGYSDHDCWQRPEDMTTPRTSYKIDEQHPGSDLAAETAAAFAAASIAFKKSNATYSSLLLTHAEQLYDFARNYRGKYQDSITVAGNFYPSSGYEDELLWAATWLHRATLNKIYLMNLETPNNGGTRTLFSWDDKYVGAQVLAARLVLEGKVVQNFGNWANYKIQAEQYICNCVQRGSNNVRKTSGGLLWWQQPFNALQYTTSSLLVITAYSKYLTAAKSTLQCSAGQVSPAQLIKFARSQVDYILGQNPKNLSYMVGIGSNYPQKIHHRGSSIVSIKKDNTPVSCKGGYDWYNKDTPNPNVLDGAIVGGPDENDNYFDSRSNFNQAQPTTVNNAPIIGVLARLA